MFEHISLKDTFFLKNGHSIIIMPKNQFLNIIKHSIMLSSTHNFYFSNTHINFICLSLKLLLIYSVLLTLCHHQWVTNHPVYLRQ